MPKSTQTRFVGITYHIHCIHPYTYFSQLYHAPIDVDPQVGLLVSLFMHIPHLATQKLSVGMYSGCDKLCLQILFVYFWHCHS